jgi:hypothetical protein
MMLSGDEAGAEKEAATALRMLEDEDDALSLLGVRRRGAEGDEGRASDTPVLSEDEVRALLDAARGSVPIDSAETDSLGIAAEDSVSSDTEPPKTRPKLWRPAGQRAADRADMATTLYWKR